MRHRSGSPACGRCREPQASTTRSPIQPADLEESRRRFEEEQLRQLREKKRLAEEAAMANKGPVLPGSMAG